MGKKIKEIKSGNNEGILDHREQGKNPWPSFPKLK